MHDLDYHPRPRRRLRPPAMLVVWAIMFVPMSLVGLRHVYFGETYSRGDLIAGAAGVACIGVVLWAALTVPPKRSDGEGEK